jgi:hypothetical protein
MRVGIQRGRNALRRTVGQERILLERPVVSNAMWSPRRINALCRSLAAPVRYLEIGVERGRTLERVIAEQRVGVDPDPLFALDRLPGDLDFHRCTSEAYFAHLDASASFEVIFIDGLHTFEQTYSDLLHALEHLAPNGAILIDDTVPSDSFSSIANQHESLRARARAGVPGDDWHGDVWKVVFAIAVRHRDLEWRTVVGSGNPQTLVWRPHLSASTPVDTQSLPDCSGLDEIAALCFGEVFADGIPAIMCPAGETDALAAWRAAIAT